MAVQVIRRGTKDPSYQRHPGSESIDDHRDVLPDNQWVAASATGRMAVDPTIDGLLGQLRLMGINPADVAVAFITQDFA